MKKYLTILAASFVLSSPFCLFANLEDDDYGSEEITKPKSPFSVIASYDAIGKSKFSKKRIDDQHIRFSEGNVTAALGFYYNEEYDEGAAVSLGYTFTQMQWKENPFFDQDDFHTLNVNLAGFTRRVCNWYWKAIVIMDIDAREWDITDYSTYDMILWGRYQYCKDVHLHIGIVGQTGMKMDRVYPILGFDWKINRKWMLNAVFPMNVSIAYSITEELSVSLAGRSFDSRQRVGKDEPLSKAVFRYQNIGAELGMTYDNSSWIEANIHAGATLGGKLRIASRHNKHPKHFDFKSAPYVGGELTMKF